VRNKANLRIGACGSGGGVAGQETIASALCQMPDGVTMKGMDSPKQSQSEGSQDDHRQAALAAATRTGVGRFCETKPIGGPGVRGVRNAECGVGAECAKQGQLPEGLSCETKPVCGTGACGSRDGVAGQEGVASPPAKAGLFA